VEVWREDTVEVWREDTETGGRREGVVERVERRGVEVEQIVEKVKRSGRLLRTCLTKLLMLRSLNSC